jgi:hypothetical protein
MLNLSTRFRKLEKNENRKGGLDFNTPYPKPPSKLVKF